MSTRSIQHATGGHHPLVDQPMTIARLRAAGIRVTAARRAVIAALHKTGGHPSAERLAAAAPGTDVSSVYRTLDMLVEVGAVQHVQTPHGPAAYHLLHDAPAHPHAQCTVCGVIVDLPAAPLAGVSRELERSLHFAVVATDVTLVGECANCRPPGRNRATSAV